MDSELQHIADKVRSGRRIDAAEALALWRGAPLWLLGELADGRKRAVSGDKVYYNRNFHIEPTNRCVFNCRFCSYRRPKGDPEAWDYSMEEIEAIARAHAGQGMTEVHIVGGVHPDHDLDYYVEMIRRVKAILPEATVKAFTAIELSYMIRRAGLSLEEGLRRLREAGMEAIPGGGAEIDVYKRQVLLRQHQRKPLLDEERVLRKHGDDDRQRRFGVEHLPPPAVLVAGDAAVGEKIVP